MRKFPDRKRFSLAPGAGMNAPVHRIGRTMLACLFLIALETVQAKNGISIGVLQDDEETQAADHSSSALEFDTAKGQLRIGKSISPAPAPVSNIKDKPTIIVPKKTADKVKPPAATKPNASPATGAPSPAAPLVINPIRPQTPPAPATPPATPSQLREPPKPAPVSAEVGTHGKKMIISETSKKHLPPAERSKVDSIVRKTTTPNLPPREASRVETIVRKNIPRPETQKKAPVPPPPPLQNTALKNTPSAATTNLVIQPASTLAQPSATAVKPSPPPQLPIHLNEEPPAPIQIGAIEHPAVEDSKIIAPPPVITPIAVVHPSPPIAPPSSPFLPTPSPLAPPLAAIPAAVPAPAKDVSIPTATRPATPPPPPVQIAAKPPPPASPSENIPSVSLAGSEFEMLDVNRPSETQTPPLQSNILSTLPAPVVKLEPSIASPPPPLLNQPEIVSASPAVNAPPPPGLTPPVISSANVGMVEQAARKSDLNEKSIAQLPPNKLPVTLPNHISLGSQRPLSPAQRSISAANKLSAFEPHQAQVEDIETRLASASKAGLLQLNLPSLSLSSLCAESSLQSSSQNIPSIKIKAGSLPVITPKKAEVAAMSNAHAPSRQDPDNLSLTTFSISTTRADLPRRQTVDFHPSPTTVVSQNNLPDVPPEYAEVALVTKKITPDSRRLSLASVSISTVPSDLPWRQTPKIQYPPSIAIINDPPDVPPKYARVALVTQKITPDSRRLPLASVSISTVPSDLPWRQTQPSLPPVLIKQMPSCLPKHIAAKIGSVPPPLNPMERTIASWTETIRESPVDLKTEFQTGRIRLGGRSSRQKIFSPILAPASLPKHQPLLAKIGYPRFKRKPEPPATLPIGSIRMFALFGKNAARSRNSQHQLMAAQPPSARQPSDPSRGIADPMQPPLPGTPLLNPLGTLLYSGMDSSPSPAPASPSPVRSSTAGLLTLAENSQVLVKTADASNIVLLDGHRETTDNRPLLATQTSALPNENAANRPSGGAPSGQQLLSSFLPRAETILGGLMLFGLVLQQWRRIRQ
ncbi:MAG: hypothetical protein PHV34_12615 [Verrucomicrobiae bacterium]|nr:hypothetical protein [Verrucomicrobiae bacterium]